MLDIPYMRSSLRVTVKQQSGSGNHCTTSPGQAINVRKIPRLLRLLILMIGVTVSVHIELGNEDEITVNNHIWWNASELL